MKSHCIVLLPVLVIAVLCVQSTNSADGDPYGLISKVQTACEVESISIGTKLADNYNILDEATDHDSRIHSNYLVENLAFAEWMVGGVGGNSGLTAQENSAEQLRQRGGWGKASQVALVNSSYWSLENKWVYMLGDATLRQVWATFASATHHDADVINHDSHEWLRSNCNKQSPHRTDHSNGEHFPEEGWGGHRGMNEVTCHVPGFGPHGKLTFDWKHFPWEDYDQWLFGDSGPWSSDHSVRSPDILVIQTGTHTCMHAIRSPHAHVNETMISQHTSALKTLFRRANGAVKRRFDQVEGAAPLIIAVTAGRVMNGDPRSNRCTWKMNRLLAYEAHLRGIPVVQREEIEHRLMFRTEHSPTPAKVIKAEAAHLAAVNSMKASDGAAVHGSRMSGEFHLPKPCPQVVASSLLTMISCLARNGTRKEEYPPYKQLIEAQRNGLNEVHISELQQPAMQLMQPIDALQIGDGPQLTVAKPEGATM